MRYTYNPRAYVPGGSTPRVARAIQALGWRKPRVPGVQPIRPPVVVKPPVDPLLGRANSTVEQMFSPLFSKLGAARAAAEANARSAYGSHASSLEKALQATAAPVASSFDTAISQSAKLNEAVANRLAGQGQSAGAGLATQLAQISADPGAAAELAKFYTGAGNAGFAHGAADLQHLIARRGEAGSFQGKLPGIARLTANQDLQSALSQFSGEFAQQEGDLRAAALDKAYDLYGTLRDERQEDKDRKAAERVALIETAQKERARLSALQLSAVTQAEKNMFAAQQKELDRQLKRDIANLNADVRLATDNPPKPASVTGPANQRFITVNGKKVKNPNYVPSKPTGSNTDTWETPGSAKRNRVEQRAWNAVVSPEGGWNADVLRKLRAFPRSADAIINTAINQAMRSAGVKNPNHPTAKEIRRAIRIRLSGRTYAVEGYDDPFTFKAG